MARRSSLNSLPNDVLEELKWHIEDDKMSADELEAWLQEKGFTRSRTAIALFAKREREQQEKRRQWREMTKAAVEAGGDNFDDTAQGRLASEVLTALLYDSLVKTSYDGEEPDTDKMAMYAKIIKDLAGAKRQHQDYEIKHRETIAKEERERAVETVEKVGTVAGLSKTVTDRIKKDILGIE